MTMNAAHNENTINTRPDERWAALRLMLRYLTLVSVSLSGVMALFLLQDAFVDQLHIYWRDSFYLKYRGKQLTRGMLPVPFVFMLWVCALERGQPFTRRFSPLMAAISLAAFVGTQWLYGSLQLLSWAIITGTLAGLFVFLPVREWARRAVRHKRLAAVALTAMFSLWVFYAAMQSRLAIQMLYWTGTASTTLLGWLGLDMLMVESMEFVPAYDIYSSHFSIILVPDCCGFEGIFLMVFMLSITLMMHWERLGATRLLLVYACAVSAFFCINVIRIALLFLIGDVARRPGMPDAVAALNGAPYALFHSYLGWGLDMLVFALFALWLFRSKANMPVAIGK